MYPTATPASDFLAAYCSTFNTVEGNTTLYAWPSEQKVQRWAGEMPEGFRFCAKFPRDVSQAGDLRAALEQAHAFQRLLLPLGRRVTPFWLQLPASVGPSRFSELAAFIDGFDASLAIEVRHPGFFDRGDGERALNRLLRDRGIERICLDTRALFSCHSRYPAVLHAQSKKPRLPIRPVAFSDSPQVRFVGHPELEANDAFMAPWLDKVAGWIEAGKTPHVYLHTPDNHRAPELAMRFHGLLSERLPGLPVLPALHPAPQMSLLTD